jgi:hypothetical protein
MKNIIGNKSIILALIVITQLLTACIEDVGDINLPQVNPKLVIHSLITPNDSVRVIVRVSKPVNYNLQSSDSPWDFQIIRNARVTITNTRTGVEIVVPFMIEKDYYAIPPDVFSIEPGEEYKLEVTATSFPPITATTRVPMHLAMVTNFNIDIKSLSEIENYEYRISGTLADPANEENYYTLSLFKHFDFSDSRVIESRQYNFTDIGNDGNTFNFRVIFEMYTSFPEDSEFVSAKLITTDKHYYKFYKMLDGFQNIVDNPFTESSHLYSNIEGGLGIFGSYLTLNLP